MNSNMKAVSKAIVTAMILLSGSWAKAWGKYECQSVSGGTKMSVDTESYTRTGHDTYITLQEGSKFTDFLIGWTDLREFSADWLWGMQVIHLSSPWLVKSEKTLTIVTIPKDCGQGSCKPSGSKIIHAILKLAASTTFFSCQEISSKP